MVPATMARPLRLFPAIVWLLLAVGCQHQTLPARQFTLHLNPAPPQGAIVLCEQVEQSGGGDCPTFDPERSQLTQLAAIAAEGRASIAKPEGDSDVWWLGARYRAKFARWTIFAPGCVVTTIYPEGRDIWDAGVPSGATIIPRLGWCAPY